MQGEWILDGSEADGASAITFHFASSDAATTTATTTTNMKLSTSRAGGRSPMNLLYKFHSPQRSSYYFRTKILLMDKSSSASLSVGVVREDEFHKGYKTKGMFYNGNLTNGSAALKTSVGPFLKQGDFIVLEYKEVKADNTIEMRVFINGFDLGLAFKVPRTTKTSYFPCVHFQGTLELETTISSTFIPTEYSNITIPDPLEGKWILQSARSHHDGQEYFPPQTLSNSTLKNKCMVTIAKSEDLTSGNSWNVTISICNSIATRLVMTKEQEEEEEQEEVRYTIQNRGIVRSTMMMPPPPFDQIETSVANDLENHWSIISVNESTSMLFMKDSDGRVLAEWSRAFSNQAPPAGGGPMCTSYLY